MPGSHYYLVCALPSLGDLGSVPPLSPAALRELAGESTGPAALVDAILLGDDLLQRDATLAGETTEAEPAVLSPEQVRGEQPLPSELAAADDPVARPVAGDAAWAAYFRHAAAVAQRRASAFLAAWVGHEVALRNALAAARAKALDLDVADYLVTPELGDPGPALGEVVTQWAAAATPLEGLKVLDRARWEWLGDHDAWFSFGDDELAVYAARLIILVRWHRLSAVPRTGAGRSSSTSAGSADRARGAPPDNP